MPDAILVKLTFDSLCETLQQVGYRVEKVTDPVANIRHLRSSTGGLAFDIHPGNRLSGEDLSFADVSFAAVLRVQGELPLELVNRWNITRRFARLQLSQLGQPFLVFCMDVSVAGGVTPAHLRLQIETWDRLAQELVSYLRDELHKLGEARGATPQVASNGPQSPAPQRDGRAQPEPAATVQ